jgi:uncharacterized protein (DUF2062 family)
MPKKFIKNMMPHPKRIMDNALIQKLGPKLQDPGLWHINRRSVSGAVALGLFCAFIPFPFQMFIAALGAIFFRVNILISVPMVWITNPITITPFFYFCYQVGVWILGTKSNTFNFELTFTWLSNELSLIWQPFLLGCLVVASVSAFMGYSVVRLLWRYQIVLHIRRRKQQKP